MAQPFYARKTDLRVGPRKGQTVYSAQVCYYGVISTKQMAQQIAEEASLTRADVIGVLERMAHFCRTHMGLGYKIKLDGIGTLCNEFVTSGSVATDKLVTAKLVKSVRPTFHPEYTIVNGSFRYALLPEKTELEKVTNKGTLIEKEEEESDEDITPDGSESGSGTEGNPL